MSEKNANNVDQIRELIFGSQIKEFEEKFNKLEGTLQVLEEKISKTLQESYNKLQKETERSLEALEEKIDNLSMSTQKERSKLKELIDTTDETLQTQINNQKNEFLTKLKIMKENVDDESSKMNEKLVQMRTQIESSLSEGLRTLGDEKLSRDVMANMLLDVAMKIQGTDVSSLLTEESETESK